MRKEPPKQFALEVNDLFKAFDGETILKKLNLKIPYGKSVGIMGPSGTGKSVLLKCILGLVTYEGQIFNNGKLLTTKNRNILFGSYGMLVQGSALFDSLNVWQNITFKLTSQRRVSNKDALEIAIYLLKDVGLTENVAQLMLSLIHI